MKFKAKKRVILSDFEPFLTLKFAKKMFSRAILPYRAVAKCDCILLQPPCFYKRIGKKLWDYASVYSQKTCFPMVQIILRERIHLFVAVTGL